MLIPGLTLERRQWESIGLAASRALQVINLHYKLLKLVKGSLSCGFETMFLFSRLTLWEKNSGLRIQKLNISVKIK